MQKECTSMQPHVGYMPRGRPGLDLVRTPPPPFHSGFRVIVGLGGMAPTALI